MSAELPPDELHRWPRNPYRLLGVGSDVDARELKRAYGRLIRNYKPEHFPEQFRRIRDAYETILQQLELFGNVANEAEAHPPLESPSASDGRAIEDHTTAASSPAGGPTPAAFGNLPSVEEQLDALWNLACDGDAAAAYREAVELERRVPGKRAVCERLYWLLDVEPELDGQRHRLDWLAAGLRNGWSGSFALLYGRELAGDAAEAAGERCARLLHCESRPEKLLDLARRRWQAIEADDVKVEVIRADLGRLRSRMQLGADLIWAQMLLAALENLAWAEGGFGHSLWQEVCEELQSLHHLELRLANDLLRLDMLKELATAWHALRKIHVSPQLLKVVRLSWSRSIRDMEAELDTLLGQLNRDRRDALKLFDVVYKQGAIVLTRLAALLSETAEFRELGAEVLSPDGATKLTIDRLLDANAFESLEFLPFSYAAWRTELMPFLLEAAISPLQFARVLESQRFFELFRAKDLARELANDVPLNCLWLAHRLFWA